MVRNSRRNFSPEFRLKAAQLIVDRHYTVTAAATVMNADKSTINKWVRQLREECAGKFPKGFPMRPERLRNSELKNGCSMLKCRAIY